MIDYDLVVLFVFIIDGAHSSVLPTCIQVANAQEPSTRRSLSNIPAPIKVMGNFALSPYALPTRSGAPDLNLDRRRPAGPDSDARTGTSSPEYRPMRGDVRNSRGC